MRDSTKKLFAKHGWRLDRALHNYFYFLFYAPYVKASLHVVRFVTAHLAWVPLLPAAVRAVFHRYHSKVLVADHARQVLTLDHDLSFVGAENQRIIPYDYAAKIIFQSPEFLAVMDCPCKLARAQPCEPVNSCLAVGKNLASFWIDHCQKYHARRISQAEALALVRDFRRRGHVTQAFFKVATGGSTGVICNCCADCCVSLEATRLARRIDPSLSMNASSGFVVAHDPARCAQCGACARICPVRAIAVADGTRAYRSAECLGCELCVEHCPHDALRLERDPARPAPLDLAAIEAAHDATTKGAP